MAEDSLEPLVTQCPTCRTRFRVTEVQLGVAGGRVRCGACLSVFTGLDNLVPGSGRRMQPKESADTALDALLDELRNEAPPPRAASKPERAQETPAALPTNAVAAKPTPVAEPESEELPMPEVEMEVAPVSEMDVGNDGADDGDVGSEIEEPTSESDEVDLVIAQAPQEVAAPPEVTSPKPVPQPNPAKPIARDGSSKGGVRSRPVAAPVTPAPVRPARVALDLAVDPDALMVVPPPRRRWWVRLLLPVFVVGLGAAALYFQFNTWTMNPTIRPVYEWLCPRLGCQLPELRDIGKMESRNLVVRSNPNAASGLLVDAIIVNQATFPQPFPDIELHFSALDGSAVKTQVYHPAEYLAGELKGIKMIAPMTPVHIALDIDDPGPKAVNYVMAFCSPQPGLHQCPTESPSP